MGEKKEEQEETKQEIVLKVDMHCQACARKVSRALKGFEGVEEVSLDSKAGKVVVKGKTADPIKVCERIQKKSGRKVELISPLPSQDENKNKENEVQKQQEEKKPQEEDKKDEPPPVITLVLKVRMHCEACANALRRRIKKIEGVEEVKTDLSKDQVEVKGVVEPSKLVDYIYKKTGKQASVVEEKKEEKKEEEAAKKDEKSASAEKKEENGEAKGEQDDESKLDIKRNENWMSSRYYSEYYYPPQQIFSDENPNACSIM